MIAFSEYVLSTELGLIYGFLALGAFTSLRMLNFTDLTCNGSFIIGAATASQLIFMGINPWIATICSFLAGGATGLLTGFFHLTMRISDIFSGIITAYMGYSIGLHILQSAPNLSLLNSITIFTDVEPLPVIILITLAMALLYIYFFSTRTGLAIQVAGYNTKLAEQFQYKSSFMIYAGLGISNALIGFSGGVISNYQEFFDISQGAGSLIIGLSTALLGEKLFARSSLWSAVLGCFLGSIVYQIILAVALRSSFLGLEPYDINIVMAFLMVIIIRRSRYANS